MPRIKCKGCKGNSYIVSRYAPPDSQAGEKSQ